jgi:hypothetical protein
MEGSLVAYTIFENGNVLNASQLNDNLMNQSVIVFGSDLARDSAIPTPPEGMLTYLEDTNRYESYNGSDWVPAFGLTLIKKHDIGTAVSSIPVTDVFSSDFDNYKIIASGGVGPASAVFANMIFGATTSGYYVGVNQVTYAGVASTPSQNNAATFVAGVTGANGFTINQDVLMPFQTVRTQFSGFISNPGTTGYYRAYAGFVDNNTSYTGFTINLASGTMTGGSIYVYGYKKA